MTKTLQVGVKVLFKSKKNTYLLLHRNLDKYNDTKKNPWDIVGGRIDAGETLFENLQREVFEETQFNLDKKSKLSILGAQDIILEHKHVVRITYEINLDEEFIPQLSEEHTNYKWVSFEELKELADKFLKQLL